MRFSKHNIVSRLIDSDKYFIVNILMQNADLISGQEAEAFYKQNTIRINQEFIDKGYLVDEAAEDKLFRNKYLEFLDSRENDEIQIFFSPTYTCNFNCSYCYQGEYDNAYGFPGEEVLNSFFAYIQSEFVGRKKYITLFGGEPLLNNELNRKFLIDFLELANKNSLEVAVVTNGYFLEEFIPILSTAKIREIQVTLDGTAEVHNKRRSLKDSQPTFNKIVKGIDSALSNKLPVNLRVVVDKENISNLPELADFAIDKGWTESELFKTQLGRNYELHHCQSKASFLYSRIDLYKDLYQLIKKYPQIIRFHKPAFSVSKFLFEQGSLPEPLFDSCPGTKTEWAFDYTGKIYSCTATIGKQGEELGTFYPQKTKNHEVIRQWENRDVLSIKECTECSLQLACGGGCASVAKNRAGDLNSPDCRPIKELLELGISYYFGSDS
jgi:uncharacterized protein